MSCSDSPQIIQNYNLKKILKIKRAHVTYDTATRTMETPFITTQHHMTW
jgi:hypothetical protein